MLSFLREQSNGRSPAKKPDAAAGTATGDVTEKANEQEYLTVAAHEKRARRSTTLLTVLFIIGLLCLWFMIKKSAPKAASAAAGTEEVKIEAAIARLTGVKSEMFNGMDEIVRKFYEFSDVLQVKVSELVKNPFEFELLVADLKKEPDVVETVPDIGSERMWQQQIRQKTKDMQLLSIMQSDRGKCCMISNKILYEGDSIKDFKVSRIGESYVQLEWAPKNAEASLKNQSGPVEIVLKLSE